MTTLRNYLFIAMSDSLASIEIYWLRKPEPSDRYSIKIDNRFVDAIKLN